MGKKLIAVVATCCLALALCACGNGDESTAPTDTLRDESAERYAEFHRLIGRQPGIYSFDSTTTTITGDAANQTTDISSESGIVDYSSMPVKAYWKFSAPEEVEGCEYYIANDRALFVNEWGAADRTTLFLDDAGEMVDLYEFHWLADNIGAADIASERTDSSGNTVFHCILQDGILANLNTLDKCTSAEAEYAFSPQGELIQFSLVVDGFFATDQKLEPATTSITTDFRDFGKGSVPSCPAEITSKFIPIETTDAKIQVKQLIDKIPANITAISEMDITTEINGISESHSVYCQVLRDAEDDYRSLSYVELDGNEDDAIFTLQEGNKQTVIQNDLIKSETEDAETSDPSGTERAIAAIGFATEANLYEYTDGMREYVLEIDPEKYLELLDSSSVKEITSAQINYFFDESDQILSVVMFVEGIPAGGGSSDRMSMEGTTWYSNFGTTEVPSLD